MKRGSHVEKRPQWLNKWLADATNRKLHAEETLILDVTERIIKAMEDRDISRADLAHRLETSRAFVSQLLDGSRNMTLRTLADICLALGLTAELDLHCEEERESEWIGRANWEVPGNKVVDMFTFIEKRKAQADPALAPLIALSA